MTRQAMKRLIPTYIKSLNGKNTHIMWQDVNVKYTEYLLVLGIGVGEKCNFQ